MKILDYKNLELPKPRLPAYPYVNKLNAEECTWNDNWIWNLNNISKHLATEENRLSGIVYRAIHKHIRACKRYFGVEVGVYFGEYDQKIAKIIVVLYKGGVAAEMWKNAYGETRSSVYHQPTAKQRAQIKQIFKILLTDMEEYNGGTNE